ncbi:MAG TPA: HD domain-containing phosphohydrolase, partial [Sphaerochaeta sp.]|nr:HD domain-containing phosphohydrolase [Sphaerochaeta sp.]
VCPDPVASVLQQGRAVSLLNDTILIARDGFERYIDDSASPIMDRDKMIKGVVLVFRDTTEKKREQDKILQLSYRDALTGLYNRRYYEQIKKTVDTEPYYPLTLVLGDVNGLKLTNDAFGHDAGDQLLKKVSAVFRKTCREGDIITRLGGDEFILLLPRTDALNAKIIVNRLNDALFAEEIRGLRVSVSFGYSVKNADPVSFDETFKLAEDSMYIEKLSKSSAFKKHAIDTLLVKQFELNQWEKEHSIMVGSLSKSFAQAMGFTKEEVWQVERGACLHDLGKIAIDESILSQKESLTQAQWLELKRHPEIGYTILRSVGEYAPFAEYVLYHHERWDGTGYPQKLKGFDIPQPARMIAIVDSYVAMISNRAYKQALTPQEAIEELYACRGTQFDPDLVPIFVEQVLSTYPQELSDDL